MREHTLARLLTAMPDDELRAARHDTALGLSLLRPGSALHSPAQTYLGMLDAELAQRSSSASPAPDTSLKTPPDDPAPPCPHVGRDRREDLMMLTPAQLSALTDLSDQWSFLWDKKRQLWIAAQDSPDGEHLEDADLDALLDRIGRPR
jgi:hypothetical protein